MSLKWFCGDFCMVFGVWFNAIFNKLFSTGPRKSPLKNNSLPTEQLPLSLKEKSFDGETEEKLAQPADGMLTVYCLLLSVDYS